MDEIIESGYSRSFSGRLYVVGGDYRGRLRLSRKTDKSAWSISPQDDWLEAYGYGDSLLMEFAYHSRTEDRLHYHISIPGDSKAKKLGVSRNGYPGFYSNAEVTDYWKIEPLHLNDEGLFCHLRDHRGFRVSAIGGVPYYLEEVIQLNVEQGSAITFLLEKSE
ncbi:hypothetical protein ABE484_10260 [Pseudomonas pudica]|uniref:hypothetical protein n=1 Tax=Pseudomonas TaxID=286 RepID=UPI000A1DEE5B|nr:hypothetical protein [Pseudomonas sp. B10(2017)]